MRKVPVLTMVGLLMVLCVPVQAATVNAYVPDIQMGPGATVSIDVSGAVMGDPAVTGGAVTDGVLEVFGADAAGTLELVVGDSTSVVQVSDFLLGTAGVDVIPIVPGSKVDSVMSLALPDLGGGGGTPGGGTPSGALIATVASISLSDGPIRVPSREIADVGLAATLNADGSYSLAAGDAFDGAAMVTLGASVGASASVMQMVAAAATPVTLDAAGFGLEPPTGFTMVTPTYGGSAAITASEMEGARIYANAAIEVGAGSAVTLQVDYMTDANVNLAIIAFDGEARAGNAIAYNRVGGGNIVVGETGTLSVSYISPSGYVIASLQAAKTDAGTANVTFSNLMIVDVGPDVDVALNPNAKIALPVDGSIPSIDGWGPLGGDAAAASGENNFETAADAGSMLLATTGTHSNAAITVAGVPAGVAVAECYVKAVNGPAGSTFALALTDGGDTEAIAFVPGDALPTDGWARVIASTDLGVADTSQFLVVQMAGGDALVDDVSVRVVNDLAEFADLSLLGL